MERYFVASLCATVIRLHPSFFDPPQEAHLRRPERLEECQTTSRMAKPYYGP
jgi:hypothetical protein